MLRFIYIFVYLYIFNTINLYSQNNCVQPLGDTLRFCKGIGYNIPFLDNCPLLVQNAIQTETGFQLKLSKEGKNFKIDADISNGSDIKTYIPDTLANGTYIGSLVSFPNNTAFLAENLVIELYDNLSAYLGGANFSILKSNTSTNVFEGCKSESFIDIKPSYRFFESNYIVKMPLGAVCTNNINTYNTQTDGNYLYFHFSEFSTYHFNLTGCDIGSHTIGLKVKNGCGEISSSKIFNIYTPLDGTNTQVIGEEKLCLNNKNLYKFSLRTSVPLYSSEYYWVFNPKINNCYANNPIDYTPLTYTTTEPFLETDAEAFAQQMISWQGFGGSYELQVYAKKKGGICESYHGTPPTMALVSNNTAYYVANKRGIFIIPPRISLSLDKNVTCTTEKNGSLLAIPTLGTFPASALEYNYEGIGCVLYELYNVNDEQNPVKTGYYSNLLATNNLLTGLPAGEYYIKFGVSSFGKYRRDGYGYAVCYAQYFNNECSNNILSWWNTDDFLCRNLESQNNNNKLSCCFYTSNVIRIEDGSPFFNILCTSAVGCGTSQEGTIKVKAIFPGFNGNLSAPFAGFVYRLREVSSGLVVSEGHISNTSGNGAQIFNIIAPNVNNREVYNIEIAAALGASPQEGCYNCFTPYCKSEFDIRFESPTFQLDFLHSAWQDNIDTYFKCDINDVNFKIPVSLSAQVPSSCNSNAFKAYNLQVLNENGQIVWTNSYSSNTYLLAISYQLPIHTPGRYKLQWIQKDTYEGCITEKYFEIIAPEITHQAKSKDITCRGDLGEVVVEVFGGQGVLGYKWKKLSGVAPLGDLAYTGNSLTGLSAGVYQYFVTMPDIANYMLCDYIATGTATIGTTASLVSSVVFNNGGVASCEASSTITLTSLYTSTIGQFYTIEWLKSPTQNGIFTSLFTETAQQGTTSTILQTLPNAYYESNAWYKLKITDPNGCVFESVASKMDKPNETRTYTICLRWESYNLTPAEVSTPVDLALNPVDIKKDLQNQVEACLNTAIASSILDLEKCNDASLIQDALTLEYEQKTGHYMLYYYDRAGRLTKTIPPSGVRPLDMAMGEDAMRLTLPAHKMATTYEYNSLGQVLSQQSPDGGRTHFVHDKLGRIRFSEDAQQRLEGSYSYKKYDNLGRVYEVGKQQKGVMLSTQHTGQYTTEIGETLNQYINLDAVSCGNTTFPRTYQINNNSIPAWLSATFDDNLANISYNENALILPDIGDATTFRFTATTTGNLPLTLNMANAYNIHAYLRNETDGQVLYNQSYTGNDLMWNVSTIQGKIYTLKITALQNNVLVNKLTGNTLPGPVSTPNSDSLTFLSHNSATIVWQAITPPSGLSLTGYEVTLFAGNQFIAGYNNDATTLTRTFTGLLPNTRYKAIIRGMFSNNTQQNKGIVRNFQTLFNTILEIYAKNNTENQENRTLRLTGTPSCDAVGITTLGLQINDCPYPITIAVNNKTTDPIFNGTLVVSNDNIGNMFPCVGSSEETITIYTTLANITYQGNPQRYLLNRVSYAYTNNKYDAGDGNRVYNYYSYDNHGHVEWLAIDVPGLPRKFVAYEYDLLSGKVHKVKYNEGQPDQFFHKYEYDADNRLLEVYTSTNNIVWDKDAKYQYYAHGPLQRIELGHNKIQGLDYVYTIQGWLKGINSPQAHRTPKPYLDFERSSDQNPQEGITPKSQSITKSIAPKYETEENKGILDVGQDGNLEYSNAAFAPDQFGMALSYFNGDYISEGIFGEKNPFSFQADYLEQSAAMNPLRQLYNGNISAWTTHTNRREGTTNQYTYDRLHRIISSRFWKSSSQGGGLFSHYETKYHQTDYVYDGNGNIQSLKRTDNIGNKLDAFRYRYADENTSLNKLDAVRDDISDNEYDKDLKGTKTYQYDAIGNIIRQANDKQNGITDIGNIEWNAYGKVAKVNRLINQPSEEGKNTEIIYLYDPMGNRVMKKLVEIEGHKTSKTFYTRDAQGNVLSIYENGKQKKYEDDGGVIYYFDDKNELLYATQANGQKIYGFDIKGKLLFEEGNAFVCITKISEDYKNCHRIPLREITDENLITQTEVPIYGADRIGTYNPQATEENDHTFIQYRSYKRYELKDHLGNVRVTVSDSKHLEITKENELYYHARVLSYTDYYPFGMEMVGRNWSEGEAYRQGYNGKENDKDFGEGVQDYGFRIYDNQIAKFLSIDPLDEEFPWNSVYAFAENDVIRCIDLEGAEKYPSNAVDQIKFNITHLKEQKRNSNDKKLIQTMKIQIQEQRAQLTELKKRIKKGSNPDNVTGNSIYDVKNEDGRYNYGKSGDTPSGVTWNILDLVPVKVAETKLVHFSAPAIPINETIEGNIATKTFNLPDNSTRIIITIEEKSNQFHSFHLRSEATNRVLWFEPNTLTQRGGFRTFSLPITREELMGGNFVFTNIFPDQNQSSNDIPNPPIFPIVKFIGNGTTEVPTGKTIKMLLPNPNPKKQKK